MNRLSYLLAVLTIIFARLSLHALETAGINRYAYFLGIRWHHLYTGALLTGIGFLLPKQNRLRPIFFGLGAGLIIDESPLILNFYHLPQFTYWYWGSWLVMLLVLLIFLWIGKDVLKKRPV